jgi:predicted O-methyltransferase YrrM
MNLEHWTAADHYVADLLISPDPVLEAALQTCTEAGLPPISVAPNQGKLLQLLVKMQGARNILEIGTLGGYSTIWLARALPADGHLVTLEAEPLHARIARKNIARAGLEKKVEIRSGQALDILKQLVAEKHGPCDFIFIDADKESYADYFSWSLKLYRRGTCIIADNVVRNGAVIDPAHADPRVQGVRRFNELLAAEPRVTATTIQTVGGKGYDGFTLAIVTAD